MNRSTSNAEFLNSGTREKPDQTDRSLAVRAFGGCALLPDLFLKVLTSKCINNAIIKQPCRKPKLTPFLG